MARKIFRGNTQLKAKGVSIDWSPEMISEYVKCRDDIFYFIEHYFKIITEDGPVTMVLRSYQRTMIEHMLNGRFTLAVMARQSGKTECFRAYLIWYILFNDYKTVAIVANIEKMAMEVITKLQISYALLPDWLQLGIIEFNKGSFVLENNSRLFAAATSKDSLRGFTVHVLVIDEAAHVENWQEFYGAVSPTISAGKETKLIMASTPLGLNHFYEFFTGSIEQIEKKNKVNKAFGVEPVENNGFHSIFVPWHEVPGRDEAWRKETLKMLEFNERLFDQEYNCSFIGSSGTLLSGHTLKQLQAGIKNPIHEHNGIKFYEMPVKETKEIREVNHLAARTKHDIYEPNPKIETKEFTIPEHNYAIVADVSRGKSLDYSAFSVFNINSLPYRQVAVFRDNSITPTDYAGVIEKTARFYNDAAVLVEINDIGDQVSCLLMETLEYDNVLCTASAGRAGKQISPYMNKADKGVRTTLPLKNSGCLLLKLLIEQEKLLIYDKDTIDELLVFSKDKNTYKAEPGKNDDLAMGLVLFAWLSDQKYFKEMYHNTMESLGERDMKEVEDNLLQFGYITTGIKGREVEGVLQATNMNIPWSPWEQGNKLQWYEKPATILANF